MSNGLFDTVEETAALDSRSLETLESRINEVLERLVTLTAEKQELQRQVDLLTGRLDESTRMVEELSHERELLRRNQRDVEQEELIRSKISALLAKLETA